VIKLAFLRSAVSLITKAYAFAQRVIQAIDIASIAWANYRGLAAR